MPLIIEALEFVQVHTLLGAVRSTDALALVGQACQFWYTNSVESYFALLKRGMMGSFHSVSEAHLFRYLAEFDFRHNNRKLSDAERGDELLKGAKGKRLMYDQPCEAANA